MKKIAIFLMLSIGPAHGSNLITELLQGYREQGAGPFSEQAGEELWKKVHPSKEGDQGRSCTNCHGDDLKQAGKHLRTGKRIEPMAPTANPQRLIDGKKIEKWFKRNCKWTVGRKCTPQEKGDLVLFMQGKS